jgi:hypothetical protein
MRRCRRVYQPLVTVTVAVGVRVPPPLAAAVEHLPADERCPGGPPGRPAAPGPRRHQAGGSGSGSGCRNRDGAPPGRQRPAAAGGRGGRAAAQWPRMPRRSGQPVMGHGGLFEGEDGRRPRLGGSRRGQLVFCLGQTRVLDDSDYPSQWPAGPRTVTVVNRSRPRSA